MKRIRERGGGGCPPRQTDSKRTFHLPSVNQNGINLEIESQVMGTTIGNVDTLVTISGRMHLIFIEDHLAFKKIRKTTLFVYLRDFLVCFIGNFRNQTFYSLLF